MKRSLVRLWMAFTSLVAMSLGFVTVCLFRWPDWEPSWLAFQIPVLLVCGAWCIVWADAKLR